MYSSDKRKKLMAKVTHSATFGWPVGHQFYVPYLILNSTKLCFGQIYIMYLSVNNNNNNYNHISCHIVIDNDDVDNNHGGISITVFCLCIHKSYRKYNIRYMYYVYA